MTMSHPIASFWAVLKAFFMISGSQKSILQPVLQALVQVSSAFLALQWAASDFLKVVEIVEVCFFSHQSCT
jgi:hypothetical protein